MRTVYLDNNATTQVAPEVVDAMLPFLRDLWGNPSSMHQFGGQVAAHIERARAQVAALLHCDPSEIIFTGCGTESDNTAIRGAVEALRGRARVITTRVEHQAVLAPCLRLRELGHELVEIGVDEKGTLNMAELQQALAAGPAVVSVMWANNETGVVFPIRKIARMVQDAGGVMHTDAVQVAGKLPIDLSKVPVDMLSLSGHKLHAPKGVGVLFVRRGVKFSPLLLGGHQEGGRRSGTENTPAIVALGRAAEMAAAGLDENAARMAALRDRLEQGLLAACPHSRINGDPAHRLPNTTNISFEFVEGEAILYHLSDAGVCASSGSACTSGSLEPSHVIRAMGVPFTAAHGSIRFSLSRFTTEDEIDYVVRTLPGIVSRLREMSPFAPGAQMSGR
jgi:cysteine desulfurase